MNEGNAYVLDENADHALVERAEISRWMEFAHASQRERGLVLLAGERLRIPVLKIAREPILWMRCLRGLPEISADGLDVEIWQCDGGTEHLLLALHMDNGQPDAGVREIELALPVAPDDELRLELRCEPGPANDPTADWLGITGLVICSRDELALRKAQSQQAWRLANEIAHFDQVYTKDFYRDRQVRREGATVGPVRPLPMRASNSLSPTRLQIALRAQVRNLSPRLGENAFGYAHRMLQTLIPQSAPDFAGRLRELSQARGGKPVRWLSLCAGTASVEGTLLESADVPVELCLVDVNAGLLETAAMRMPANVVVERVQGNANEIGPELGAFDLVNITSGLHHLVELERVLGTIARMLHPDGEFWLIGEQVGRNGSRLWPEAVEKANEIFSSWPREKRLNHNSGRVDEVLPDVDCSSMSFEGIRSQDINDLLSRYFLPVDCYMRNAFLWRLVDVAYAANFDPMNEQDRRLLRHAVVEEALLWARGARGTELHGVFRSKWARLTQVATRTLPLQHPTQLSKASSDVDSHGSLIQRDIH